MAKLESTPAKRLEDGVRQSVVRVRIALGGWTGRPAALGAQALELLEEVEQRVKALNKVLREETLEAQAAKREAERGGAAALAAVRQFHARAHAWMWNQRAESAALNIPEDPHAKNFALFQWLEGMNPSGFEQLKPTAKAKFLVSINARKGDILGDSERDKRLAAALEAAMVGLGVRSETLTEEQLDAEGASRQSAEALRRELAPSYQAAQDILSAALRLQGQHDQLEWYIPSFWKTVNPSKRGVRRARAE